MRAKDTENSKNIVWPSHRKYHGDYESAEKWS